MKVTKKIIEIRRRARLLGRNDACAKHHNNAGHFPPGGDGHADYWLGHQDVEFIGTELSDLTLDNPTTR